MDRAGHVQDVGGAGEVTVVTANFSGRGCLIFLFRHEIPSAYYD